MIVFNIVVWSIASAAWGLLAWSQPFVGRS